MHTLPFVMALLTSGIIGLACVAQAPAPTTTPAPTINIQATVAFLVKAELATVIPTLTPPDNNLGYSRYVIEPFVD